MLLSFEVAVSDLEALVPLLGFILKFSFLFFLFSVN